MKHILALLLFLVSFSLYAQPQLVTYDSVGTVNTFDASERKVSIDYQEYQLPENLEIEGTTRRGEYGDELLPGQTVGYSVGLSNEGKPVINQIVVIKNAKEAE